MGLGRRTKLDGIHLFTGEEVLELRRKSGLNQTDFWRPFGVNQSGGCRYETGRGIPRPVQVLLNIAFGEGKNAVEQLRSIGKHTKS